MVVCMRADVVQQSSVCIHNTGKSGGGWQTCHRLARTRCHKRTLCVTYTIYMLHRFSLRVCRVCHCVALNRVTRCKLIALTDADIGCDTRSESERRNPKQTRRVSDYYMYVERNPMFWRDRRWKMQMQSSGCGGGGIRCAVLERFVLESPLGHLVCNILTDWWS